MSLVTQKKGFGTGSGFFPALIGRGAMSQRWCWGGALCCTMLFALLAFLFYMQINASSGYPSDLKEHLQFEYSYSVLVALLQYADTLKPHGLFVALCLAGISVGTIFTSAAFFRFLRPHNGRVWALWGAIAVFFVMPIYIPQLNPNRYVGLISGTLFHNSTYLGMKFFVPLVLLSFFHAILKYDKINPMRDILFLALFSTIITAVKPNFILVFGIVFMCMIVHDMYTNMKNFHFLGRAIFLCSALLPSAVILLLQYVFMFNENNQISLGIMEFYRERNAFPFLMLLQSLLFPLLVFMYNFKCILKSKIDMTLLAMWALSFFMAAFLHESGARAGHGNWTWGVNVFTYMIFIQALAWLWDNLQKTKKSLKDFWYLAFSTCALFAHIFFGIVYFARLLRGKGY